MTNNDWKIEKYSMEIEGEGEYPQVLCLEPCIDKQLDVSTKGNDGRWSGPTLSHDQVRILRDQLTHWLEHDGFEEAPND
jgi:hypothetical protein